MHPRVAFRRVFALDPEPEFFTYRLPKELRPNRHALRGRLFAQFSMLPVADNLAQERVRLRCRIVRQPKAPDILNRPICAALHRFP